MGRPSDRDWRLALNEKARVSLMIYSLAGGGAERATVELAAGLSRSVDAVDLVVARAEGAYLEDVPSTVRLVDLGATSWLSWLRRLVTYLRDAQPTRLVGVMDVAAVIALVAARLARSSPRIIVSVRNTFSVHTAHAARWKERLLLPYAVRRLYPRADAIVAVSEGVADDLARAARIPRSRITVIHEPIVTEELLAAARAPVEHPWFAEGGPPVLLAAGRLTAQKDYPTLLRAFRAARERARDSPGGARRGRGAGAPGGARAGARSRLRGGLRGLRGEPVRVHGPGVAVRDLVRVGGPADGPGRGDGVRRAGGLHRLPERPGGDPGAGQRTGAWWRWATTGRWPRRCSPRSTILPRRSCCGGGRGTSGPTRRSSATGRCSKRERGSRWAAASARRGSAAAVVPRGRAGAGDAEHRRRACGPRPRGGHRGRVAQRVVRRSGAKGGAGGAPRGAAHAARDAFACRISSPRTAALAAGWAGLRERPRHMGAPAGPRSHPSGRELAQGLHPVRRPLAPAARALASADCRAR